MILVKIDASCPNEEVKLSRVRKGNYDASSSDAGCQLPDNLVLINFVATHCIAVWRLQIRPMRYYSLPRKFTEIMCDRGQLLTSFQGTRNTRLCRAHHRRTAPFDPSI
jgi:hypothetical protein